MCLDSIKETYDTPSTAVTSAQKGFGGTNEKPLFAANNWLGKYEVPLDQWITAEQRKVSTNIAGSYTSGFHAIEGEGEDAKKWMRAYTVHKTVFLRQITARGLQNGTEVVIAKEMYVPSDPNGWPPHPNKPNPKKDSMLDRAKRMVSGGSA